MMRSGRGALFEFHSKHNTRQVLTFYNLSKGIWLRICLPSCGTREEGRDWFHYSVWLEYTGVPCVKVKREKNAPKRNIVHN